jgi:anti-sigma regulatory factor (Ser/Thr protein kinase)
MEQESRELLKLSLCSAWRVVGAAGAAVAETARSLGIPDAGAEDLQVVVEELCDEIIEHGFDNADEARLDISVRFEGHRLKVVVDDLGDPLEGARIEAHEDSALQQLLAEGLADDLKLVSRGQEGNRAELTKRFPASSVVEYLDIAKHHERLAADPVAEDAHVEIHFMEASEATALAECIFHSYGYSYDAAWVYEPDTIRTMIEHGTLRSVVGVSAEGEIVGHLGFRRDDPDAIVGESGQAVVDPRYRGHHMLGSMKRFLADWAPSGGIAGLYSEATAAHPASQKANLKLGAHETGLLLGYIPSSVSYAAIEKGEPADRLSVVLIYMKTGDGQARRLYAPGRHREMIGRIVESCGLIAELTEPDEGAEPDGETRLEVNIRADHNQGLIRVHGCGADVIEKVADRLRYLCLHKLDVIYVDLALADPATPRVTPALEEMGFFFGGITPNLWPGSDVLRLQFLNNVELDPANVTVASDFGQELLDYVAAAHAGSRP